MLAANLIINKVLQTKDFNIIKANSLDASYFAGYEDEFNFIVEHYKKYGNIPDELPFAERFPNFDAVLVNETDDYLVDKLQEEYGYQKFCKIIPELDRLVKEDSRVAYNYLTSQMANLKPHTVCKGFDIISGAEQRYEKYITRSSSVTPPTISTGLPELDEVIGGWEFGEELVMLVARTAEGKSWVQNKFLSEAWKQGKRVGLYSGEMSAEQIGYRFDAMYKHFSNHCLQRGSQLCGYQDHINDLKNNKNPYIVITQKDFGGRPTVQQLENFITENNIEILGVDQLSLMKDGRATKNDPPRLRLAHIAEDLFALSTECGIPIIAVTQANRDAIKRDMDDAPALENIKESDDISHNCSKCIGIRKMDNALILSIIKNRYGRSGVKLFYNWDVDNGIFTHLKTEGNSSNKTSDKEKAAKIKKDIDNITDINPF